MTDISKHQAEAHRLSRRHFLGALGAAAASAAVSGCAKAAPGAVLEPTRASASVDAVKPDARPKVAVAQAMTYDRAEVRKQVRQLLDLLGGLKGVVKSRDRVAIKVNLTGGLGTRPLPGVAAIDSYITHPEVVRALAEAVKEAGAREVTLVESVYEWASFKEWGYEDIAADLGLKLVDLNMTDPYKDFAKTPVGKDSFVYPDFTFNHILEETDVFMSVPKMKCHYSAGITLSMKNLVGLVPARFYRLELQHNHRSALHGSDEDVKTRLPRVIVDLNRARPIHFALIDGIKSTEGGKGRGSARCGPMSLTC